MKEVRNLVLVLGDQLNRDSAAFDDFDDSQDVVWMAEVQEEATHVWCHQRRIALFFAAMRHFRDALREAGFTVHYHELTHRPGDDLGADFATVLRKDIRRLHPRRLILVRPGDYRVLEAFRQLATETGHELQIRADRHFYCSVKEFEGFAGTKKLVLMETFYRWARKRHGVLMSQDGKPLGGAWNFDKDNRDPFGPTGPGHIPHPPVFRPDQVTGEVLALVAKRFSDHPGNLQGFDLPVTPRDAQRLLEHFATQALAQFGPYEDAMWCGEPFLYHSRLSSSLNLKLLNPRECVSAAVSAYESGSAPLNSVEGFVRQILGWREYIRGIYWRQMPDYESLNYLGHTLDVPSFYWDGQTDMACVRACMRHVLDYGYAHHIERLMVLGMLAQLVGVHPRRFHEWHMAMYVDAVDWVSLPNALGMSQYGDGGLVGTKPYCATGNYINRMSNYCGACRYSYKSAIGERACPFTTLYWDFLDRHYGQLKGNARLAFQIKNLERKRAKGGLARIRQQAQTLRTQWFE